MFLLKVGDSVDKHAEAAVQNSKLYPCHPGVHKVLIRNVDEGWLSMLKVDSSRKFFFGNFAERMWLKKCDTSMKDDAKDSHVIRESITVCFRLRIS